jgi:hypothetical protein
MVEKKTTSLDRFGMNKIIFMTLFIIKRFSLLPFQNRTYLSGFQMAAKPFKNRTNMFEFLFSVRFSNGLAAILFLPFENRTNKSGPDHLKTGPFENRTQIVSAE